jgi:hypothetical protein
MLNRIETALKQAIATKCFISYDTSRNITVLTITDITLLDSIPMANLRTLTHTVNALVRYRLG